jgi:hypothetical protein
MHALVEGLKWLVIFLAWTSALTLCWALVRIGSSRRDESDDLPAPIPLPRPAFARVRAARPQGHLAKVIPLRHG